MLALRRLLHTSAGPNALRSSQLVERPSCIARRCATSRLHVAPGEFPRALDWLQTIRGVPRSSSVWMTEGVMVDVILYEAMRPAGAVAADSDDDGDDPFDNLIERAVLVYRANEASKLGDGSACEAEAVGRPAGEHTFSHAEFSGYEHGDPGRSVLCMVDNPRTLVQRVQLGGGLSYMQAPAVVQYYARWHARLQGAVADANAGDLSGFWDKEGAAPHGMLDLAWFVANCLRAGELERHVFDGKGQSSVRFLRQLLLHRSQLLYVEPEEALSALRRYGPALVSGFRVFPDFCRADVHKHHDSEPIMMPEPEGESDDSDGTADRHAMVLVGARVDAAGRRFFLLQNWWAGKQFVEVSQEYLEAAEAQLWFVATPQTYTHSATAAATGTGTGMPPRLRTHAPSIHYAESAPLMDLGEQLP